MLVLCFNAINPLIDFICYLNAEYEKVDENSKLLGIPKMNSTIISSGDQVNPTSAQAESLFNMRTIPSFDNRILKNSLII